MPMRQDCKHFESRTYRNGETVRKCDLDLAPEAPWRCPADCPKHEPRFADVNWSHGALVTPPTPAEPLDALRSEEHTSELQSLMRNSYAVFCLKKKNITQPLYNNRTQDEQDKQR